MEKFYCDHCRTLYNSACLCENCGSAAENKIWIEVQSAAKVPSEKWKRLITADIEEDRL